MSASVGANWDKWFKKVLKADGKPIKEQNGLPLVEKITRRRLAETHRDVDTHLDLAEQIITILADASIGPDVFAVCFIDRIGQGLAAAEAQKATTRVNDEVIRAREEAQLAQATIERQNAEIARLRALAGERDASESDDVSQHPLNGPAPAGAPAPAPKGKGRPKKQNE